MEFFFAVFFLLFYYIRPQDWMAGLSGMNLIQPIIGMWLLVIFAGKSKSSPFPGFARTPHDWIMLVYLAYIVFLAEGPIMGILPYLAFYFLTVHSVNSWERLLRYLTFWNGALIAVSSIAVLSTVGLDFTGAQDNYFTQTGRLAIGTWLHNNPNALCHAVVVAISSSYLLYFWRKPMLSRLFIFPGLASIVFYCAWLTQSKGGYLVGAGTLLLTIIIGRPKWIQALVIAVAMVGGVSVLSFMPRMNEMGDLRNDDGFMGRILAWEMARTTERNNPTGVGWKQFTAYIEWEENNQTIVVPKATHSSYVQVGADLGKYGLFLYLACLWCGLHTLVAFKSTNTLQERCRRVLLAFFIANLISGWMVNRQYHTEYFLMIAATGAMHRLRKGDEAEAQYSNDSETVSEEVALPEYPIVLPQSQKLQTLGKPLWDRFGLVDMLSCMGLTWLTLATWDYLMKNV